MPLPARKPIFPVRVVIAAPLFDTDAEDVQLAAQRIERHPIPIQRLIAAIHLFSHRDCAMRLCAHRMPAGGLSEST